MKIITLKQPWATIIAEGLKYYEFRSWKTSYRGELLIHAGGGVDTEAMKRFSSLNLKYPKYRVVAKVNLVDCIKLNEEISKSISKENEYIYGTNNKDGYAWKIDNIKKINSEEEIKGKLSIWEIDEKKAVNWR